MHSAPARRRRYASNVMRLAIPHSSANANLPRCLRALTHDEICLTSGIVNTVAFPRHSPPGPRQAQPAPCLAQPGARLARTGRTVGIPALVHRVAAVAIRSRGSPPVACGVPAGTSARRAAGPSRPAGGASRTAGGSGAELLCLVYHVSGVPPLRPSDLSAHSRPRLGCCRTPWMCRCHRS
jgi:hypothetical protein